MDQIAGHVTNYKNLRKVAERDPELAASWHEIHYYVSGGAIERFRERVPFVPSYLTGILRGALEMRRALRQGRYQALFSNASVGVFFAREFRRIPTLLDFDSTPLQLDRMPTYTPKPDPLPLAKLKWRLSRDMMHATTLLQAWSRWAKDSAVKDYGVPAEKVIVNPPGVDLTQWRPTPRAREARGRRRVLFVGGDFKRKGGELLLAWFRTRRLPDVELHVVTREEVPAMPGVSVYGNITPNSPELLKLYAESDLFVLPSLGECFGIATVEAMAAGLPVIASDVGGTADIIEPERNGLIVPSNDVRALGDAIESILGDPAKIERFGAESRLLATERFDVDKNAELTFAHLKSLARGSAGVV